MVESALLDAAFLTAVLWLALAIDWAWGEPPVVVHPVVWMGHYLGAVGRRIAPAVEPPSPHADGGTFVLGALAWCAGAAIVSIAAWGVDTALARLPGWAGAPLLALALKPLLAWRMLHDEVAAVEAALAVSLDAGRARLARLVSRDVTRLSAAEVRESAIETLAENLNDSVVAPLFWFVLLGLPGAALYRFANTADAMWGYRGRWEWAGKWAARADDLLSWLPARVTAVLLLRGAPAAARQALRTEARRTPSPNGGWPMGAMALRLGVRLSKPGVYTLHADGQAATAGHTRCALALAGRAVVGAAAGASAVLAGMGLVLAAR